MRILIDMDGVLSDFDRQFKDFVVAAGYRHIPSAQFGRLWQRIDGEGTRSEKQRVVQRIVEEKTFWSTMPWVDPYAIEVIQRWQKSHLDLRIVTTPWWSSPESLSGEVAWVQANMPFFPTKQMVLVDHKSDVVGDILIDDKMDNINSWPWRALVYDQPWNRNAAMRSDMNSWTVRVQNWHDIEALVDKLSRS